MEATKVPRAAVPVGYVTWKQYAALQRQARWILLCVRSFENHTYNTERPIARKVWPWLEAFVVAYEGITEPEQVEARVADLLVQGPMVAALGGKDVFERFDKILSVLLDQVVFPTTERDAELRRKRMEARDAGRAGAGQLGE